MEVCCLGDPAVIDMSSQELSTSSGSKKVGVAGDGRSS